MSELSANDSGTGRKAILPESLQGLNWGALFLTIFWGLAMKVPRTWLCLIPGLGFLMPFLFLFKGNEWAWQHRFWDSPEHFKRVQSVWAWAGLLVLIVFWILLVLWAAWLVFDR